MAVKAFCILTSLSLVVSHAQSWATGPDDGTIVRASSPNAFVRREPVRNGKTSNTIVLDDGTVVAASDQKGLRGASWHRMSGSLIGVQKHVAKVHPFDDDSDIFTAAEEHDLRTLENDPANLMESQMLVKALQLSAPSTTATIYFLTQSTCGSANVRGQEAALICKSLGMQAESAPCSEFCKALKPSHEKIIAVHVKETCDCALAMTHVAHIYDPIDTEDSYDQLLRRGAWHGILTGTSLMKTEMYQAAARLQSLERTPLVELLPHHHSNFHDRRHSDDTSAQLGREKVVGIAGDFPGTFKDTVASCLLQNNLSHVSVKLLTDVQCDTKQMLGPSVSGDCFATKLSQFDFGIVWHQFDRVGVSPAKDFTRKPPQRLVNMLSVGIPVVADGEFAGHQDVAALGHNFMSLAKNDDELCPVLVHMISNPNAFDMKEGIRVAQLYGPSSIASLYNDVFRRVSHELN